MLNAAITMLGHSRRGTTVGGHASESALVDTAMIKRQEAMLEKARCIMSRVERTKSLTIYRFGSMVNL